MWIDVERGWGIGGGILGDWGWVVWAQMDNIIKNWQNITLRFLGVIMFVLGASLLLAFIISISITLDISGGLNLSFSKDLLTPLIAVLVGGIALLAYFRDKNKIEFEKNETTSKILYEQSKEGLEHAYETLKSLPQDRIEWIYAANSIIYSDLLGKEIVSENYRIAYKSLRNKYQERMQKILRENGECIPAAFFFGDKDWKNKDLDLRDVQKETETRPQLISVRPYKNDTMPVYDNRNFELATVVTVMCFLNDENYFIVEETKIKEAIERNAFLELVNINKYETWHEYKNTVFGARLYIDMKLNPPPKDQSGGVDLTTFHQSTLPPNRLPLQAKHLVND